VEPKHEEGATNILSTYDESGDDALDKIEFKNYMQAERLPSINQPMSDIMFTKRFDMNDDGFITRDEIE
jgi:hypothetical protein